MHILIIFNCTIWATCISADSKLRLLSMRKPEMQKYVKLARDKTVPSIVGFVRKERGEWW